MKLSTEKKLMKIYRVCIPKFFRDKMHSYLHRTILSPNPKLYAKIKKMYRKGYLNEYKNEVEYILGRKELVCFPYSYTEGYKNLKVTIEYDNDAKMYYVLHYGKKLYYPNRYKRNEIEEDYKSMIASQDKESPHLYFDGEYTPTGGEWFFDIGSADGMMALNVIDKVSKCTIIECDKEWVDALEHTFAQYKDKCEIINKFCGDNDEENTVSVDSIVEASSFKGKIILKMDVEGAAMKVLKGAEETIDSRQVMILNATYHTGNEAKDVASFLKKKKMKYSFSKGYLLFIYDLNINYPFFRKAMIRTKNW